MTTSSIAHQLRRQSIVPVESTTPPEMTIEQWRSSRRVPCHHLHDTTTRYDCVAEVLSFLLVCTVCGTARVVETGATSRASTPAPTTGAAPRSATPHEAAGLDRSTLVVAGVATLAYCGRCNAESP